MCHHSDVMNKYIKLHDYFLHVTSNYSRFATRQLWWTKYQLSCVITSFPLHQIVWGVPSTSCNQQNIKLHDYLFSRYIKLFEVCHPPVVMNKILSCMIILFALHQTVWGVPPVSYDEQNIKLHDYFFLVTSNCLRWGKPANCDEQNIKLRYYLFRVYILILGSVSPASSDEQKHYAAWLFLSL